MRNDLTLEKVVFLYIIVTYVERLKRAAMEVKTREEIGRLSLSSRVSSSLARTLISFL